MKHLPPPFDWLLAENSQWPPHGKPSPPFGPTALEALRSCALRLRFEASVGYERRTEYIARVGIAFHRTLQSLTEDPLSTTERDQIGPEALCRFQNELEIQEQQRSGRKRRGDRLGRSSSTIP
jgi:hypothetical protein